MAELEIVVDTGINFKLSQQDLENVDSRSKILRLYVNVTASCCSVIDSSLYIVHFFTA